MRQLTQKLKSGQMSIVDANAPKINRGHILIVNHYSMISSGTEGSTVKTARKGYIGKAKERPQQVKQVLDVLKSQGPVQTYRAVMKKLDAHSPLGYSCAGVVIGVGRDVREFSVGDPVACGGLTASHAEVVSVPENLCVKLAPDADLKQAAYNTLGAIALQGVRQADLRLGETCAIIGLGLLGQLTGLLLKASGIRAVGIDVDPAMVKIAGEHAVELSLERGADGIDNRIADFTGGLGCDAVIITAGSSSLDPINFAGSICRKKGTVVVVGAVPTGFDREPHYYKKELQVKMSCSYGPGRYDPEYEEKGIDYPPAYVRWTEKRNMQAFQELIYSGKINVSYLTTHVFKLEKAPAAYDMILKKSEPSIGILIEYDTSKDHDTGPAKLIIKGSRSGLQPSPVSIGFIGAGSYAQSHLLPNIPKDANVSLKGVMTSSGTSSRSVADRFGFEFCCGDERELLENDEMNTVFIATRHDSHAEYVMKALKAGKHVFVEKPLCLNEEELKEILFATDPHRRSQTFSPADSAEEKGAINKEQNGNPSEDKNAAKTQRSSVPLLMVGYNRRFSPLAKMIKKDLGGGAMAMNYRINAGNIPPDSWIQDMETGGGRIIGEVCHFVDFLTFMNGSLPVSVSACAMSSPSNLKDTVQISLSYANGSIGSISYFANGDKSLPKERVEIYSNGCTAILEDFKEALIYSGGKSRKKKLMVQDKGQKEEVKAFIQAILKGESGPIPLEELVNTSLVTFRILESLQTGQTAAVW